MLLAAETEEVDATTTTDAEVLDYSDKALIAYSRTKKMKKDFHLTQKEMVLPMTVTELWDNFFSNEAMFNMDKALKAIGDKDI